MISAEIRAVTAADRAFVVALSAEVFGHLGDYRDIMSGWFDHPGVSGAVATVGADRLGFVLFAFIRYGPAESLEADLVAIAVRPAWRGRGVGRRLLRSAIDQAARAHAGACEIGLCVAEANAAALRLFLSEGFTRRPERDTRYPAGQLCWRMGRSLPSCQGG